LTVNSLIAIDSMKLPITWKIPIKPIRLIQVLKCVNN